MREYTVSGDKFIEWQFNELPVSVQLKLITEALDDYEDVSEGKVWIRVKKNHWSKKEFSPEQPECKT